VPIDGTWRTAPSPRARLRLSLRGSQRYRDLPARSTLRRWVGMALGNDASITLVFVDRREARRLNRQFRSRDYATNVLTFAYQMHPRVLADIVLCLPVLRHEARLQGKSLREHLAHLVVHGVLHAQGYDHAQRREAQKMEKLERHLLARLRIADPYE